MNAFDKNLIHWTRSFDNKVFNKSVMVWVGIYESKDALAEMHSQYFGSDLPEGMAGLCWHETSDDNEPLIRVAFVKSELGVGVVAHEFLHAAFHAYRIITGRKRINLRVDETVDYGEEYHSREEYVRDPEEMICDLLDAFVHDFWSEWGRLSSIKEER